jgi:hypothetical protein
MTVVISPLLYNSQGVYMNGDYSLYNAKFIYDYLTSVLSHHIAVQVQQTILHWVKHHGVEWTVNRLKDLHMQRINYDIANPVRYVASHSDGTPVGSFRPLWRMELADALRVLKIYTCVKLDTPTTQQMLKFTTGVNSSKWNLAYPLDNLGVRIKRNYYFLHPYRWISSPTRRAPIPVLLDNGDIWITSEKEDSLSFDDMASVCKLPLVSGHVSRYVNYYSDALWINRPTLVRNYLAQNVQVHNPKMYQYFPVGKIGFIQEKGAKLRAIANPFRIFQVALEPLGNALLDILQSLPWDCTFDQEKGVNFVQDSLLLGKEVSSIDLSSATDKFPLKIQRELVLSILRNSACNNREVANSLYRETQQTQGNIPQYEGQGPVDLEESLNIFCEISRGDWFFKIQNQPQWISWQKGQPLGLHPSFAMFALTHGILLRNIEKKLGKVDTFRVLGDDVVINDPKVAQQYREDLDYLGCEISVSKTLVSKMIGEFGGKIIDKNGPLKVSKFRPWNPNDVFGPLDCLGLKGAKFVPPSLRKKILVAASAPEPVGLGLNPKALPLSERMPPALVHWWYNVHKDLPDDETLSIRDRKHRHELFWRSVSWRIGPFGPYLHHSTDDTLPVPFDQKGRSFPQIVVDHVRAVNKSCLFPDDIQLHIDIHPSPQRGRAMKGDSLRAVLNRILIFFREYRRTGSGK